MLCQLLYCILTIKILHTVCRTNLDSYQAISMDLSGLHFFVSCDVTHWLLGFFQSGM